MAEATAKTETVITGVTLELTLDEATVLADIMSSIGGSAFSTRRGLTNQVLIALREAGVYGVSELDEYALAAPYDLEGSIYFSEKPRLDPAKMIR